MKRRGVLFWASVSLFVFAATPVLAQSAGNLRGTVKDELGDVVVGASVVLKSESTSFTQRQTSDGRGGFFFAAVTPGRYRVEARAKGFQTFKASGLRVGAKDTLAVSVQLQVGNIEETIDVVADSRMIQTSTGAREGLITPEQIESLSIMNRNPLELVRILPGVVAPDASTGAWDVVGPDAGFGGNLLAFSINGARPENLGITLDGANLRDIGNNGGMMNVPNNEFVAEIKVQTSNYAAEFGNHVTSVQAVTKSGSAELHGSLYYYGRPHQLQANDRSRNYLNPDRDNPDFARPESRFHYPGFTLSGPILIPGTGFDKDRDKAFFFLGYELQKQELDTGAVRSVVPPLAMRDGDFNSYLGGQNLNLGTTLNVPGGWPDAGQPVPGRDFSPYITDTGRALMNLYPAPNYSDPDNLYNYVYSRPTDAGRQQGVLRVDYNISAATRAYVRLARDRAASKQHRGPAWNPSSFELPTPSLGTTLGLSAVANVTSVLSPTTTNEVIVAWSRLDRDNEWEDPELMMKSHYGITDVENPFPGCSSPYVPQLVNLADPSAASLYFGQDGDRWLAHNGFLRLQDNLTKVIDAHALKAGVLVERQWKEQNLAGATNGVFGFAPWGAGGTGNAVADMLAGRPAQASVSEPSPIGKFVAWSLEAFAQDSWKVSRNLTLELGLRFGYWSVNKEVNDLGAIFLPEYYLEADANGNPLGAYLNQARTGAYDPTTGERPLANGLAYASLGDVPQQLTDDRPLLFMPRLNFAWDVKGDGATIVRGGAGAFYVREQGNAQYNIINLPPNSLQATFNSWSYPATCPTCGVTYAGIGELDPFSGLNPPGDLVTPSADQLSWPRTLNASLSIARRLPWENVVEIGYVGSWGRNLNAGQWRNVVGLDASQNLLAYSSALTSDPHEQALLRAAAAESVYSQYRPYPTIGGVGSYVPVGVSDYNSLQVTLSRPSGAFTYLLAYTLSRAKGTVGGDLWVVDPGWDWKTRDYGLLPTDRTHILNASWTWRLGQPIEHGLLKYLLNDWNLSGISTWSSGQPWRPVYSGDLASAQMANAWFGTHDFIGGYGLGMPGAIAPTYRCDPQARGGGSDVGDYIWDLRCIGIPEFGDSGPNYPPHTLRVPGKSFHDLTVFKDFPLGGSRRLQLRLGVFNIFNQAYADMITFQDIDSTLEANCTVLVGGVDNGAGGTWGGCHPNPSAEQLQAADTTRAFELSDNTLENFGKIITKHGHRTVEIAVRLFF